MCKWCEQIVIYLGVIRFTHLKTSVDFLYLTLSENESQFNLENISAYGVMKAHCKIIRADLFRPLLRILSWHMYRPPHTVQQYSKDGVTKQKKS